MSFLTICGIINLIIPMITRFYFRKIDAAAKNRLRNYFLEKKSNSLARLLKCANPESPKFSLAAQHHQHRNIFSVALSLSCSKNILAVSKQSHNLMEAFDLALNRLALRLRRIEGLKHNKPKRIGVKIKEI